jgi:hypothetical protein
MTDLAFRTGRITTGRNMMGYDRCIGPEIPGRTGNNAPWSQSVRVARAAILEIRGPGPIPVERVRSMAIEGRARPCCRPGVIDPSTRRIRRIEINKKNGGIARVKMSVHMGRLIEIPQVTFVAGKAYHLYMGDVLSKGPGPICHQRVRRCRARRVMTNRSTTCYRGPCLCLFR